MKYYKYIFYIICICAAFICSGCSTFDMHVKNRKSMTAPSLVLIDTFELRDMNYDPHAAREFSEAIRFELFRKGYLSRIISPSKEDEKRDMPERARLLCGEYKGDIFVTGVISRRESGFLTDRKISTGITFLIYNSSGVLLGEGYFSEADSPDMSAAGRKGARKFTGELISEVWGG
jgi:hypothetical protein